MLVQASVACHVRIAVNVFPHAELVTVPTIVIVGVGPQTSVALGASKLQAVPHSMVLDPAHVIVGGVVSTTVTVWLHSALLVQASVACHVRIAVNVFPHAELVTVLTIVIIGAGPQTSVALGASKLHAVPHSMVLDPAQVIVGGVVSTTVTVWLHCALLVQASVACQVRVAVIVFPHDALVTVLTIVIVGVGSQASVALGVSKLHAVPHSMSLSPPQV